VKTLVEAMQQAKLQTQPEIFLVWASVGEYDDRDEWPVCWFDTEAAARDCAVRCEEISKQLVRRSADDAGFCAFVPGKHAIDARWHTDGYHSPTYTVVPVRKGL